MLAVVVGAWFALWVADGLAAHHRIVNVIVKMLIVSVAGLVMLHVLKVW